MGVFHVFRIVQIVQNRAKHQILSKEELIKKFNHLKWKLNTFTFSYPRLKYETNDRNGTGYIT